MRKKLFAILMSAMMMVTFMPAMAFAGTVDDCHEFPTVYSDGVLQTGYTVLDNGNIVDANSKVVGKITKAATCTEKGTAEIKCKKTSDHTDVDALCEATEVQSIKATHKYADKAVEVTVEEVYQQMLADKVNKATAYEWKVAETAKLATSAACYLTAYKCSVCGDFKAVGGDIYAEVGHVYNAGLCGSKVCVKCGFATKATSHSTEGQATYVLNNANCGHGNETVADCKVCGKAVHVSYNDATITGEHNFGTPLTQAQFDKLTDKTGYVEVWTGKYEQKSVINGSEIRTVDDQTKPICVYYKANAVVDGYKLVKCANCGYYLAYDLVGEHATVESNNFYKLGKASEDDFSRIPNAGTTTDSHAHEYEWVSFEATCDQQAGRTQVCTICGAEGRTEYTGSAKGYHKYVLDVTAPTCCKNGSYTLKCSVCEETIATAGHIVTVDGVDYFEGTQRELKGADKIALPTTKAMTAVGHTFGAVEKFADATCELPEIWAQKCSVCGKWNLHANLQFKGDKLGHVIVEQVVAPTCGEYGYTVQVCSRCGKEQGTVDGSTVKPVVAYGAKCDFTGAWKTVKAATIFEEGTKAVSCAKCGAIDESTKAVVAKLAYKAPKVSVKKGKVVVTVAAQDGAVKYVVKAGKKTKTVTAAGKVTLKKVAKKGKKVKVTVTAYNAAGAKVVSKAKTVKAK